MRESHHLSRRSLLLGGAAVAGLTVAGSIPGFAASRPGDPFALGVASGDPAPGGFVLWTRLAPKPLAEDGLGGMPIRVTKSSGNWPKTNDSAR